MQTRIGPVRRAIQAVAAPRNFPYVVLGFLALISLVARITLMLQ